MGDHYQAGFFPKLFSMDDRVALITGGHGELAYAMAATLAMFENLMMVDENGDVHPQLAAAPPRISADKLTYWFDLRDDVYFQNGQKLTAEDVKYSYEYILDPKNKGARRTAWTPIKNIIVESPKRVRFEMSHPYGSWILYMTKQMGIFPKGSREKFGDDYFRLTPIGVGTGPGIFVKWQQNDYVEFRRNPHYWQKGLPHWDKLIVRVVPEDSVRVAYLLQNQAQIISAPPPRDFRHLNTLKGIVGGTNPGLGAQLFMQLNTKKAPFDDVNFRKAIACAIDRDLLATKVFYGLLEPSATPAPRNSYYYNNDAGERVKYDKEKARSFLAKSKYASSPSFDMLVPAVPYLFDVRDAAQVIQSELAEIGITARLQFVEVAQVINENLNGTHTASLFCNMTYGDPLWIPKVFYTANQVMSKSSGYTSEAFSAAVEESYRYNYNDKTGLKPVYQKAQSVLVDDSPGVFIGFVDAANLWRQNVKNFKVDVGITIMVRNVDLA